MVSPFPYFDDTDHQPPLSVLRICVTAAFAAIIIRLRSFAPPLYFDNHRSGVRYLQTILGITAVCRTVYTLQPLPAS